MKKLLIGAPLLLLMACGGGGERYTGQLLFVSKSEGIRGDYHSPTWASQRIRSEVSSLACASGTLANFTETYYDGRPFVEPAPEGSWVKFTATCQGPVRFEGDAGFVVDLPTGVGHVTATFDGVLDSKDIPLADDI